MKQQIDKLIANTLLDEGEIYLPGKGSLILRRHAAKRLSSNKLQTPYRELTFSVEERGVNLITLISKVANVPEERASDIFAEWLSKSSRVQSPTRRSLIIGGVCTIATYVVDYKSTNDSYRGEKSTITTDQTFENMANPKGRGVERINPRPKYFIYILTGLLVGMAIGVAGSYLYAGGTFDELLQKQSFIPTSVELKASAQQTIPSTEPTAPAVEEPATEVENKAVAEANTPAEQAPAEVATQTTEPIVEPTTEQATEPTAEQTVEPAVKQVAEQTTEEVAPPTQKRAEPTIKPFKHGHSYLVWGIYKKMANAQNAAKSLAEKHPSLEMHLHRYGSSYMLTIHEGASRAECNKQLAAWQKQHKSFGKVWVFTR